MTGDRATQSLPVEVALLERAIGYARGSLQLVTPDLFSQPTPCRSWDLRTLLWHMHDSLAALHEGLGLGYVALDTDEERTRLTDPVDALRRHACRLLGACTGIGPDVISVAGQSVTTHIVAGAGAIEVAVHGWDVAQACRQPKPIPEALAVELLPLLRLLVTDGDRPGRFAPPIEISSVASPADRLVAFLGRSPS